MVVEKTVLNAHEGTGLKVGFLLSNSSNSKKKIKNASTPLEIKEFYRAEMDFISFGDLDLCRL